MSSKLMDTAPGGESDQYESIKTDITDPPAKASGQLGGNTGCANTEVDKQKAEQGEDYAETVRYGQNVSESGIGGMTTGQSGETNQSGDGRRDDYTGTLGQDRKLSQREEQGYGPGSGVGA